MLSWYSTFVGLDDLRSALTLNTTAFLSSIALLFALDRPKVAGLTLIDQLFLIFHLVVATITLGIMVSIQSPSFFESIFVFFKYVPTLAVVAVAVAIQIRLSRRT